MVGGHEPVSRVFQSLFTAKQYIAFSPSSSVLSASSVVAFLRTPQFSRFSPLLDSPSGSCYTGYSSRHAPSGKSRFDQVEQGRPRPRPPNKTKRVHSMQVKNTRNLLAILLTVTVIGLPTNATADAGLVNPAGIRIRPRRPARDQCGGAAEGARRRKANRPRDAAGGLRARPDGLAGRRHAVGLRARCYPTKNRRSSSTCWPIGGFSLASGMPISSSRVCGLTSTASASPTAKRAPCSATAGRSPFPISAT